MDAVQAKSRTFDAVKRYVSVPPRVSRVTVSAVRSPSAAMVTSVSAVAAASSRSSVSGEYTSATLSSVPVPITLQCWGTVTRDPVVGEPVVELAAAEEGLGVPDAHVVQHRHLGKPVGHEVRASVLRVAHPLVDPRLGNREREPDLERERVPLRERLGRPELHERSVEAVAGARRQRLAPRELLPDAATRASVMPPVISAGAFRRLPSVWKFWCRCSQTLLRSMGA
jgi:hypothetical protein